MKRTLLGFIVPLTVVLLLGTAFAQPSLPTQPTPNPCVMVFKSGKKLVCDSVWQDGNTVFMKVQGKDFAVGYDASEIDMKKSFASIEAGAAKPMERKETPAAQAGEDALLNELMAKSGGDEALKLTYQVILGILVQNKVFSPYQATEALRPEKLRPMLMAKLKQDLDPVNIKELLRWYSSPLGTKITGLENSSLRVQASDLEETFLKEFKSKPISQTRLALAQRLDKATEASPQELAECYNIFFNEMLRYLESVPKEKQQELRRLIESQRAAQLQKLDESPKPVTLFTYQNLSDPELERYVVFSETRPSRIFSRAINSVFYAALKGVMKNAGDAIGRAMVR